MKNKTNKNKQIKSTKEKWKKTNKQKYLHIKSINQT